MGQEAGSRYRLAAELGHGGMGEVLAARDEQIGRDVAVKRLRAAAPSARQIHRFMREACIQGRLEHPAIVPVHDLGRDADGRPFFAMKKLAGTTLAKILDKRDPDGERERVPLQRLLRAFADVCLAIELAHTRGVVHRDLKPDNIMLGDFGEVYVLDWGVAKVLGDAAEGVGEEPPGGESGEHMATREGVAIGTPGYMSPEQARGAPDVDGRSDVFQLGKILREILAATGASAGAAPPELDALCVAATRPMPADRLATARELGEGVQRFLDGDRDLAQRRELARVHLTAATEAYARGGVADHASAMRDAGRAVALDPTLAGAAELVTRLMLEPPREMPPEVERAIEADIVRTKVGHARVSRWGFLSYALLFPVLGWTTPPLSLAVLAAVILLNTLLIWRVTPARPLPKLVVFAVSNAALIAVISHLFTPILLAPGLAAVTGLVLALIPPDQRIVRAPGMIAILTAGTLAPWLGEVVGLLPRTMSVGADGVHLFGPAMGGGPTLTIVITAVAVVAVITTAVLVGRGIRHGEHEQRRRLHLQAWQLRQLVR